MGEKEEWYSNKQLYEMMLILKNELAETCAKLKEYNGLRDKIAEIEVKVAELELKLVAMEATEKAEEKAEDKQDRAVTKANNLSMKQIAIGSLIVAAITLITQTVAPLITQHLATLVK